MIAFFNTFISTLIVVIVFFIIIVCGVLIGKKLRENKDNKTLSQQNNAAESNEGEK